MADEIKEFSRDEVFGTIFPGAPSPVTSAQQSAASFTPAVSSAPVAPVAPPELAMPSKSRAPVGMPDPTKLVETVSKASKALQETTAPPEPPSAIGGLVDQVISNWKPIAATAAATYAVTKAAPIISRGIASAYNKAGAAYDKATQKGPQQTFEQTRIEPIFATEQEMNQAREASQKPGPTLTPLENLQQRANDLRAAVQAGNPAVPPQFGPAGAGVGVPPAPPYMPPQATPPAPGIGQTLATGGDVKQAIQQNIAQEIDKPEMRPTYQKSKENPIGPQAYNWVAGQQGPKAPEVWQNIVGEKNVPYSEFMERYKPVYEGAYGGGYGDPDPFNQPAKNASYRRPSMIPSQIKGAASPAAMGASAIAGVVPALAVAGIEGYKGNKEAVDRELKSAWDSLKSVVTWPYDVTKAATKGDFGPLKDVLMSVNPATLLLNEINKNDKKAIQKMIQDERQAAKVGAGRGIAPPSAYMR